MTPLLRFPSAVKHEPAIDRWLQQRPPGLAAIAQHWFALMRNCGEDVHELMHDGHPTACVGDAAFAYVNVFTAHVNVGFFRGAELADPNGILQGTGKFMRHVKLGPAYTIDTAALTGMIEVAYADMRLRLGSD